jgi:hypothetical protein
MPTFLNTSRYTDYMPAWPILLYAGEAQSWSNIKSQSLIPSLSSLLTLPGVIPPTLVPEAVEVPQF